VKGTERGFFASLSRVFEPSNAVRLKFIGDVRIRETGRITHTGVLLTAVPSKSHVLSLLHESDRQITAVPESEMCPGKVRFEDFLQQLLWKPFVKQSFKYVHRNRWSLAAQRKAIAPPKKGFEESPRLMMSVEKPTLKTHLRGPVCRGRKSAMHLLCKTKALNRRVLTTNMFEPDHFPLLTTSVYHCPTHRSNILRPGLCVLTVCKHLAKQA
jgi:hypothetical protein